MIGSVLRVRYELSQLLHEGPVFTSYAARDRVQNKEVCLRLIRSPYGEEQQFLERLSLVVAKYRSVSHPYIEQIYELDGDESQPFLVGDLTKGVSLQERIKKLAPFSAPVCLEHAICLCEGLEVLHNLGLAHGDVSAQNIAAQPDGSCKLQLTGIWESYSSSATAGAAVLPTISGYMAPEMAAGGMPTPLTDVYSVGVLLYQLLTGRLPYLADTPAVMANKHASASVPSVRMFNPSVPNVLDEIVKKAMSKDPQQRYPHAGALLSDLRLLQDALRFGKSLQWPLHKDAPRENLMVAPKMSAVRVEPKEAPRKEKKVREPAEEGSDVPIWLMLMIAFFSAIVVSLLGLWIYFNLSQPRLMAVPNVKNLKVEEARKMLQELNLKLRVSGTKPSDTIPADSVLETDPPAGDQVREGGTINVKLSSGSKFVEVPDLRGSTIDEARAMLTTLNLEFEGQPEEVRNRNIAKGLVVEQIPEPRTKVERQTRIRIKISAGNERVASDEDDQPFRYKLKINLAKIDKSVLLRVDITDNRGTRTVYEQVHFPDDEVDVSTTGHGAEALFRIFYDGHPVKQITQEGETTAPDPDKTTTP